MMSSSRFSASAFLALVVTLSLCVVLPRSFSILPGVLGIILLGLYAAGSRENRSTLCGFCPVLLSCLVIIALSGFSSLWAINPADALERTGKIASVLLLGAALFAVMRVLPVAPLLRLWWVLPAAIAIMALYLAAEYLGNFYIYRLLRGLPADQPVALSELNRSCVALCLLALPGLAVLYRGLRARHWGKARAIGAAAGLVLLLVPSLMLTDSQSALMAFVLGGGVLLAAPVGRRFFWVVAMVVACGGILSAPFLAQYFWSLAPQDGVMPSQYSNLISRTNYLPRLELWDFVSRYALQNPFTGYGIEATRNVAAFDSREIYQPGKTLLHPHNAALQIWIEFGALGAVLASAGMVLLCRRLMAMGDRLSKRLSLSVLVAVMGVGVVGYGLWQGWWIGLLMALVALTTISNRLLEALKEEKLKG